MRKSRDTITYERCLDRLISAIDKVRKYLEDKGIKNPNVYPASALTALDIRTVLKDYRVVGYSEEELDELPTVVNNAISKVKTLNRTKDLHLEQYAPLPPSVKLELEAQIANAENKAKDADSVTRSEGMKELALIHSGIIPIEAAIRMYVLKYAKTAKIKTIVDTFSKKLEDAKSFTRIQEEIALNNSKRKEIEDRIKAIQEKLHSGEEAKKFKAKIDAISYESEIQNISAGIITNAQSRIRDQIEGCKGKKWKRTEAESMIHSFESFSEDLQADVQVKLEELITQHVQKNAQDLLDQYQKKLADLTTELPDGSIEINAFELISGEIPCANSATLIASAIQTERVKVGSHKTKNFEREGLIVVRNYMPQKDGVTAKVTPFFCFHAWFLKWPARKWRESPRRQES